MKSSDFRSTRFALTLLDQEASLQAAEMPLCLSPRLDPQEYLDDPERSLAAEFDAEYYLAQYPDVRASGADPIRHYVASGAGEGRQPASWFDTSYYLRANDDVAAAGVNPFWHYVVAGRAEGRLPSRPDGERRNLLESLCDPETRAGNYPRPPAPKLLSEANLRQALSARSGCNTLVVSLGHDLYLRSTGGIQLFTSDEQVAFGRRGSAYLHVSPFYPDLVFAEAQADTTLSLVLDGEFIGQADHATLCAAIRTLPGLPDQERLLVVHSLLGHNTARVAELQRALQSRTNYLWLHDFSTLCAGFHLLRNDLTYCGVPPVDSMACRICIYGERRRTQAAQMRELFKRVSFTIVAPSRSALEIWVAANTQHHDGTLVVPHCRLLPADRMRASPPVDAAVRVGFVGYPSRHKGWDAFRLLVEQTRSLSCYEFLHFASPNGHHARLPNVTQVSVRVTAADRCAMVSALAAAEVDLVLIFSPWPETFSYVTFEALASGADVIAHADGGNVPTQCWKCLVVLYSLRKRHSANFSCHCRQLHTPGCVGAREFECRMSNSAARLPRSPVPRARAGSDRRGSAHAVSVAPQPVD